MSVLLKALEAARSPRYSLLRGAARPFGLEGEAYEVTGPRHEWLGFVWRGPKGWQAGKAISQEAAHFDSRRRAAQSLR